MKAIILAAGRGSRMGPLTDAMPKCMTPLDGQPLLHRAVATLTGCGIDDVVVVRGYRAQDIEAPGVRYCDNPAWDSTNMLGSLFSNPHEIVGELIISYADIVFETGVVETALASPAEIAPVVDVAWRGAYEGRTLHPTDEAEKVVFGGGSRISRIGKGNVTEAEAEGEFIGMLKLGIPRMPDPFRVLQCSAGSMPWRTVPDRTHLRVGLSHRSAANGRRPRGDGRGRNHRRRLARDRHSPGPRQCITLAGAIPIGCLPSPAWRRQALGLWPIWLPRMLHCARFPASREPYGSAASSR